MSLKTVLIPFYMRQRRFPGRSATVIKRMKRRHRKRNSKQNVKILTDHNFLESKTKTSSMAEQDTFGFSFNLMTVRYSFSTNL